MDPILLLAASATPSTIPTTQASDGGGLNPAWIALLGVLVTLIVQTALQNKAAKDAAKRDVANALLGHRTRQIDELYGPILPRLEQSRRLYTKLQKPKAWRMLDNIDEVLRDKETRLIAQRILELGNRTDPSHEIEPRSSPWTARELQALHRSRCRSSAHASQRAPSGAIA